MYRTNQKWNLEHVVLVCNKISCKFPILIMENGSSNVTDEMFTRFGWNRQTFDGSTFGQLVQLMLKITTVF
jgi:hypothetical protein